MSFLKTIAIITTPALIGTTIFDFFGFSYFGAALCALSVILLMRGEDIENQF